MGVKKALPNHAKYRFPTPPVAPVSLATVLDGLPLSVSRDLPTGKVFVRNKALAEKTLMNQPVGAKAVADCGASKAMPSSMQDCSPCVTRRRAKGTALWLVCKVCNNTFEWFQLPPKAIGRLQGFPDPFIDGVISALGDADACAAFGNSFSFGNLLAICCRYFDYDQRCSFVRLMPAVQLL